MSKYTDALATVQNLSVVAMEEASRYGQREADIDHLFTALTVSEQVAGKVLRDLGITLDTARDAVEALHEHNIASLGVTVESPEPGPIVFHQTGGYDWSERAWAILTLARERGKGDAADVLRQLVGEPSGFIDDLLHRLGTSPREVLARLDEAERSEEKAPACAPRLGSLSRTQEVFVPASIGDVWALVADPKRLPEWEPWIGQVEDAAGSEVRTGASWVAAAVMQRADGTPLKVKPELRRLHVELHELVPPTTVEWRFALPDAPGSNTRIIRIELAPAEGGTQAKVAFSWQNLQAARAPRLGLRAAVTIPFHRYIVWLQTNQVATGISRVFRGAQS